MEIEKKVIAIKKDISTLISSIHSFESSIKTICSELDKLSDSNHMNRLLNQDELTTTVKHGSQKNPQGYTYYPKDWIGCKVKIIKLEDKK